MRALADILRFGWGTVSYGYEPQSRILERLSWGGILDKSNYDAFKRIHDACNPINDKGDEQGTKWLWLTGLKTDDFERRLEDEVPSLIGCPRGAVASILRFSRGRQNRDSSQIYRSILCIESSPEARELMKLCRNRSRRADLFKILEDNPRSRSLVDAGGALISHYAVDVGDIALLDHLSPGCLVDKDGFGNTLMHRAASCNQPDLLKRLPDNLAEAYNYEGLSPFDVADCCLEIQQYLLDKDLARTQDLARVWRRLIHQHIHENNVIVKEALSSVIASVAAKLGGDDLPFDDHPLNLILWKQKPEWSKEIWSRLLELGLTPNTMDEFGSTILTIACEKIPELVLNAGDPAISWFRDLDGDSPADVASRQGVPAVDRFLSSSIGRKLVNAKVGAAMGDRARDSPEHYNHAVLATQAWIKQDKGCFGAAMRYLSTARNLIEKNLMREKNLQNCAYAAIDWRKGRICQLSGYPINAFNLYTSALLKEFRAHEVYKLKFHKDTALLEWIRVPLPIEVVDCIGLHILAMYQQEAEDEEENPPTRRYDDIGWPGDICHIAAGNL